MARDSSLYYDRRSGGPLALLGEAIASGAGEWSALEQQKQARAQRLADVAAERAFAQQTRQEQRDYEDYVRGLSATREDYVSDREAMRRAAERAEDRENRKEDVESGRKYEKDLYKERQLDAIKAELFARGLLVQEDFDKPEAVKAALAAAKLTSGPEFERNIRELDDLKRAIPGIIAATKGDPTTSGELAQILQMKASSEDLVRAREIMGRAYQAVASTVNTETDQKEKGLKNAALLMMGQMGKLTALSNRGATLEAEMDRITNNRFNATELRQIEQAAASELPSKYAKQYGTGAMSPEGKTALDAGKKKAEENLKLYTISALTQQGKLNNDKLRIVGSQFEGLKTMTAGGLASQLDEATLKEYSAALNDAPAVQAKASPTFNKTSTASFLDAKSGKAAPAALPAGPAVVTPATPTVTPAALTAFEPATSAVALPAGTPGAPPPVALDQMFPTSTTTPMGRAITPAAPPPVALADPNAPASPGLYNLARRIFSPATNQVPTLLNPQTSLPAMAGPFGVQTAPEYRVTPGGMTSNAIRADEDEILSRAPYSAKAQEIRRARGMSEPPRPVSQLPFGPAVGLGQ